MDLREKISDAVYDHPGAPAIIDAVMGVVEEEIRRQHQDAKCVPHGAYQRVCGLLTEAEAEAGAANARIRVLEDENQRMRDTIASRIVEEERSVQEQITKEPLNSWLAGVLFGLQRGRDIVTSPAREIAEEEA
ncbi:hypothetical protein NGM33_28765 [Nocardiopsis dassonvillei]|uniref:hypothetical protein n=1 Tax=Nocardiopsis dassonvillei TaxID=2014 RepID=UPI0020A5FC9B|nr:hypothetical protein [Nocardiopsis dassonvillei]MCP3017330.1 hypothetical protein [Nocardiopsis dassonvillei]